MADELKNQKRDLRLQIKNRINSLNSQYEKNASNIIANKVFSDLNFNEAKVIFIFVGTKGEPDTRKIIETAISQGKIVCVPKCIDKHNMVAVEIKDFDKDLEVGYYGLLEPVSDLNVVSKSKIDFCIIPCVTCDEKGNRLGHGNGYYDRFLEGMKIPNAIVCFSKLMVPVGSIPTDKFDIKIDKVISD